MLKILILLIAILMLSTIAIGQISPRLDTDTVDRYKDFIVDKYEESRNALTLKYSELRNSIRINNELTFRDSDIKIIDTVINRQNVKIITTDYQM